MTSTLGSTWIMPLVHLDFEIRKDYIYQVLCIHRDKPVTVCGGRCYLTARLADLAQHEEKGTEISSKVQPFTFYKEEVGVYHLTDDRPEISDSFSAFYQPKPLVGYHVAIFRPPRSCSL